jgi:hypothetical protein
VFAEVQVLILVAQDRQAGLRGFGVAADEIWHLVGLRVLMRQGQQRDVHAHHRADVRAPEPGAGHDDIGGNRPVRCCDARDASAALFDSDHLGGSTEHRAARLGAPREHRNDARRLGQPVGRHIQSANDFRLVDERV